MSKLSVVFRTINDINKLNSINIDNKLKKYFKRKYVSLFFKTYILKSKNVKEESILNFKIKFFNYQDFFFLFRDIFVKQEYYFIPDKKNPIIFDCGANIGLASIYFKLFYPDSNIFAFEPDPKTFEVLKENIERNNLKNVSLYNVAISNKEGFIKFFVDNERPGSLVMSTIYDRLPKDSVEVKSISLGDFINSTLKNKIIDLLKMDIEGAENVSFPDLIDKKAIDSIKEILLEYHHNIGGESKLSMLLGSLEELGYNYQFSADTDLLYNKNSYQDLMIYFYRKNDNQ